MERTPDSSTESIRLYAYLAISALLSLATWVLLLLPNFLEERHWSSQGIGWAIGVYYLVNLLFQILAGRLADRYGNVPTALAGTAVAFLGGFCYLAALSVPAMILLARILHAAGAGMIFAGALMQLVKSVPLHLRGRMMGYYGLPGFVMMGVGPMLSEWFVYRWGFKVIFVSIPVICAAIAVILTRLPGPLAPQGRSPQPFSESLRASLPGLRSVLALSVFFGFSFSAWNSFLAPAVRGIGPGAVSAFGLGYALGAVLTRLGISHRLDTGPRRLWAVLSLAAYGLGLSLIPHAVFNWHLAGLGLVCGMVHGIYYPSLSSIAAERFHPLHAGQAMSLYISASALGMFVGPPIWGAFADRAGYPFMFVLAAAVLSVSALSFVFFQRRFSEGRPASESPRLRPSSEEVSKHTCS